jgi:hypothetical protein
MLFGWLNKTVAKILGLITVIVGLFGFGYLKGKQKSDSKHEKEKQKETIESQKEIIKNQEKQIEAKQEIILTQKQIEEEKKKKIKEAKEKEYYDFGKWILILAFTMFVSCTKTEYVYIKNSCPKFDPIERPELESVVISKGMTIDNDTYNKLVFNDISLKKTIEKYELSVKLYNELIDKINSN